MNRLTVAIGLALAGVCLLAAEELEARAAPPGTLLLAARAAPAGVAAKDALDPAHAAWGFVPDGPLRLHRTPPLYAPDVVDDGERPEAAVRLLRLGDGALAVRLRWTDASQDLGPATARYPDRGEKAIYKRHSERVAEFGDAACVMVPQQRGPHDRYPSMMMGDASSPTELFYWRAGQGFQRLRAAGRGTVAKTRQPTDGRALWADGAWSVVFILRDVPERTPVAFAIWNGSKEHRDGIKYFSLWYEVGTR